MAKMRYTISTSMPTNHAERPVSVTCGGDRHGNHPVCFRLSASSTPARIFTAACFVLAVGRKLLRVAFSSPQSRLSAVFAALGWLFLMVRPAPAARPALARQMKASRRGRRSPLRSAIRQELPRLTDRMRLARVF
jgi:hypothetical protein